MKKRSAGNDPGSRGKDGPLESSPGDQGLCVTVIATTPKGTTAALSAAGWLAQDLDAKITLLKMEVVPLRFPIDKPVISRDSITQQQCSLVLQSSTRGVGVSIRICLCRDRDSAIKRALRRRALIVLGGKRSWWLSKEERLERALRSLGHHVIFIDLDRKSDSILHYNFSPSLNETGQIHNQTGIPEFVFDREGVR